MLTQGQPTYPETSDMGYAMWLRHFAAKLPAYAYRYDLTGSEVAEVEHSSAEFITWLTHRINRATQAIQQRCVAAYAQQEGVADVGRARRRLLQRVARLVRAIRAHRHYRMADGVDLGLSNVPDCEEFDMLPVPHLCLVGCLMLDDNVAVALRWMGHSEAVVDLQVCRDGLAWQPLQLLAGEYYADIHEPPAGLLKWQYRARYRRPDWPCGGWGELVTVELTEAPLDYLATLGGN